MAKKLGEKAKYSCVLNIDADTCKQLKASLTESGFDKKHIDEVIKEYEPKPKEGEEAKKVADKDKGTLSEPQVNINLLFIY